MEIKETHAMCGSDTFLLESAKCGFANLYSCTVFQLEKEASELFEVTNTLVQLPQERFEQRLAVETNEFDAEHYQADFCEDGNIKEVLSFCPDWEELWEEMKSKKLENADDIVSFSSEEKMWINKLCYKEYPLDKSGNTTLVLNAMDILYGYAYNKRTTFGKNSSRSAWTINKLSATLSWLEEFTSVQSVVHSCVRRSLCYPIYRHWDLAMTILQDVAKILFLGRKYVLKCFLEIHEIFRSSEPRHILNDLYITDYCIWFNCWSCKTKMMLSMAKILNQAQISKGDVNLRIVKLERAARLHALHVIELSNSAPAKQENCEDSESANTSSALSAEVIDDAESLYFQLKDLHVRYKVPQTCKCGMSHRQ